MLDRIRYRLSLAYVGVLALILILFGTIVVVIFSQQATAQQDELLRQKAEAETSSALNSPETYTIVGATAEPDIAVVAVPPDGPVEAEVLDTASSGSSLGLPFGELAQQAGQEEEMVAATVDGPDGPVRGAFHRQRAFVADASHELKTPLTLIKLKAEMVVREPTSPRNRKVIQDQLSEIDRMDSLVSDLLV